MRRFSNLFMVQTTAGKRSTTESERSGRARACAAFSRRFSGYIWGRCQVDALQLPVHSAESLGPGELCVLLVGTCTILKATKQKERCAIWVVSPLI